MGEKEELLARVSQFLPPLENAVAGLESQIISRVQSLNFLAISNLLKGYGYSDPDFTINKLEDLHELSMELHSAKGGKR